jgi:DNA polymerase-3 subunit alpha
LFDFAKRLNQRAVNKKTFEALALSGAFDCFSNMHRRQYIYSKDNDSSLIEKAIKFAAKTQQEENSAQASLVWRNIRALPCRNQKSRMLSLSVNWKN